MLWETHLCGLFAFEAPAARQEKVLLSRFSTFIEREPETEWAARCIVLMPHSERVQHDGDLRSLCVEWRPSAIQTQSNWQRDKNKH